MALKPRTGPRPHSRVIGPDLLCSKEGKRDQLSGQTCACPGPLIATLTLSPAGAGPGFVSLAPGEEAQPVAYASPAILATLLASTEENSL